MFFVEVKSHDDKIHTNQALVQGQLRHRGFKVLNIRVEPNKPKYYRPVDEQIKEQLNAQGDQVLWGAGC